MTLSRDPRPILVTGATGHLGANLVHRLVADGHAVRVLCWSGPDTPESDDALHGLPVDRIHGDLREPATLRAAVDGVGRVFHVAAKVSTIEGTAAHRRGIFETNVVGTRNLLRAARDAGVDRVVVTGSFSAVGHHLDETDAPADEEVPFFPFARHMPYERSKVLVEHEVLKAVADGQDVVVATSCAILGGHDYLPSRMGRTLCDFANGRLRAYVPGGFEFVAAEDIVRGHILAMEKGRRGHKYIISTRYLSLDEIMVLFEEITGVPRPRLRLPAPVLGAFSEVASFCLSRLRPSFPQRLTPGAIRLLQLERHADISKARRELGYTPSAIENAIEDAYAFHVARGAIRNPRARGPRTRGGRPGVTASPRGSARA